MVLNEKNLKQLTHHATTNLAGYLEEQHELEDTLKRIENVTKLLALLVQQAREIQQDKD